MDVKYKECQRKHSNRKLISYYCASCIFIVAMMFCSCTPEPLALDDLEPQKSEIVVSSQILPNGTLAIILTKSFSVMYGDSSAFRANEFAIDDARVTVMSRSTIHEFKLIGSGVYASPGFPLRQGDVCRLRVQSPSMGIVTSTAVVQPVVKFDTVNLKLYDNGHQKQWADVKYTFKDPPVRNYYLVTVQGAKRKDLVDNAFNPDVYARVLEDESFNGKAFSEAFYATKRDFYEGDSIAVSISAIGHDYFKYLKMRIENEHEFSQLFSEPVHYPSNVEGGKGFFNLHIPDVRVIVAK
jgi:hypothetical protein